MFGFVRSFCFIVLGVLPQVPQLINAGPRATRERLSAESDQSCAGSQ